MQVQIEVPKEIKKQVRIVWSEQKIKELLTTNERALYKSILELYQRQTLAEQVIGETREHNGIGFNSVDANILSSFAVQLHSNRPLTYKQKEIALSLMPKYWKQIQSLIEFRQAEIAVRTRMKMSIN